MSTSKWHFGVGDLVEISSTRDDKGDRLQYDRGVVTALELESSRSGFVVEDTDGVRRGFLYPWQDRTVEVIKQAPRPAPRPWPAPAETYANNGRVLAVLKDLGLVSDDCAPEPEHEQGDDSHAARIYLAGPMRGYPEFNYPAFHAAAAKLRDLGFEVFNPAECFDGDTSLPFETYMQRDLQEVVSWADEVWVLPGWQQSVGARIEVTVARAIGLRVVDYETEREVDVTSLPVELEAATHVYGARQASYGHPATDFERTGRIWGAILGIDDVPPHLVALCMAGLKISREVNAPKRDNMVDLIGYAICEARITGHEPEVTR